MSPGSEAEQLEEIRKCFLISQFRLKPLQITAVCISRATDAVSVLSSSNLLLLLTPGKIKRQPPCLCVCAHKTLLKRLSRTK